MFLRWLLCWSSCLPCGNFVSIYAGVCLSDHSDRSSSLRPQLLFASILTNHCHSSFGLCRGQKRNFLHALTTILARVACAAVLVYMVLNACQAKHPSDHFYCVCDGTDDGKCNKFRLNKYIVKFDLPDGRLRYNFELPNLELPSSSENDLCRGFKHLPERDRSDVELCSVVRLPVMLNSTCQLGHMDAIEFHHCWWQNRFYPELCNAKFKVCAIFSEYDEAYLDTFILQVCCLAPLVGLALMVLIHLVGLIVARTTNQPSLMNVSENRELRLRIRTKACHFERQLQKEQLEHSIWCLGQNCIMDRWWVSVNRIDSSLLQCKRWWPFRIIPRVRTNHKTPMSKWDQPFISMLISQVWNPYSPKVGRACQHCSRLHVELAKMFASGSQRHRLNWVDHVRFTLGVVAGNIGPSTLHIYGTTLDYIIYIYIWPVILLIPYTQKMFCAVDPYPWVTKPDNSWSSTDNLYRWF